MEETKRMKKVVGREQWEENEGGGLGLLERDANSS